MYNTQNILQQPKAKIITNPLIQPVAYKVPRAPEKNTSNGTLQRIADGLIDVFDTAFLGPITFYKIGLLFIILAFLMEFGSN